MLCELFHGLCRPAGDFLIWKALAPIHDPHRSMSVFVVQLPLGCAALLDLIQLCVVGDAPIITHCPVALEAEYLI